MDRLDDRDIFRIADSLLGCAGRGETSGHWQSSPGPQCCAIASDGSTRRFWRINRPGLPACVIAAPGGTSKEELAESRSAWKIGTHLFSKGVGVPEVYG
ncbi:MAG: aminoglycoside phosphotransferase, partial [Desulforhopalus sp.]